MSAAALEHFGRRPAGFTAGLKYLDFCLHQLGHVQEEGRRLQGAVEVLAVMLELSEQLQVRCWEVRGLLGLQARVE